MNTKNEKFWDDYRKVYFKAPYDEDFMRRVCDNYLRTIQDWKIVIESEEYPNSEMRTQLEDDDCNYLFSQFSFLRDYLAKGLKEHAIIKSYYDGLMNVLKDVDGFFCRLMAVSATKQIRNRPPGK